MRRRREKWDVDQLALELPLDVLEVS